MNVMFHSYKGGVGRTTTLVNAAYHLSRRGKPVLVIDLDVEAPGITMFEELKPRLFEGDLSLEKHLKKFLLPNKIKDKLRQAGFGLSNQSAVEIITEDYQETNIYQITDPENDHNNFYIFVQDGKLVVERNPKGVFEYLDDAINGKTCNITDYIYEIERKNKFLGLIRVMRASRPENFANIKRKITHEYRPLIVDIIQKRLMHQLSKLPEKPEYILVDTRPGFVDYLIEVTKGFIGEEDVFLMCMNYNLQNIIASFADLKESIQDADIPKKHAIVTMLKKPVHYWPELESEGKSREDWVVRIMKQMGLFADTMQDLSPIPFYPDMLSNYMIVRKSNQKVWPPGIDPIEVSYERLANKIISINEADIDHKIDVARKAEPFEQKKKTFNSYKRMNEYKSNFKLYLEFGRILFEQRKYGDACKELETGYELTEAQGGHPEIAFLLGKSYSGAAYITTNNAEKGEYLESADTWFKTTFELLQQFNPDEFEIAKHELLAEWGDILFDRARMESGFKKNEYLREAQEKLSQAIRLHKKPDYYMKLGEILTEMSLLEDANKQFEEATITGEVIDAWFLWGKNLYDMAFKTDKADEKKGYLEAARHQFESALKRKDDFIDALYYLGLTLAQLAKHEGGDMKMNVLIRASDNLNKLVSLKKDHRKGHFYLGAILIIIHNELSSDDKKPLYFRDAFYNFEWTISLNYNLPKFYFNAADITKFRGQTYMFVRTLEKLYEYEPALFVDWVGKVEPSKDFKETINKAVQSEREKAFS